MFQCVKRDDAIIVSQIPFHEVSQDEAQIRGLISTPGIVNRVEIIISTYDLRVGQRLGNHFAAIACATGDVY
ncbi:MAG: hypothetical protein STSR0001_18600 [Methanothrix sp.]